MNKPILYSFVRCPYAIRARWALFINKKNLIIREVKLSNKPKELLSISPKATVPVLDLGCGQIIVESLDIMLWAFDLKSTDIDSIIMNLIQENDSYFKYYLDRYKYSERFLDKTKDYYRGQAEHFLKKVEAKLSSSPYLEGDNIGVGDIAIIPFLRQFSKVDIEWFEKSAYPHLRQWLNQFYQMNDYPKILKKYQPWSLGDDEIFLF